MGRIRAVFKADEEETGHAYSISEWWLDANTKGPGAHSGGVTHDFENRSDQRAGVLNFSPGEFEPEMKDIAEWFAKNPPGNAR